MSHCVMRIRELERGRGYGLHAPWGQERTQKSWSRGVVTSTGAAV